MTEQPQGVMVGLDTIYAQVISLGVKVDVLLAQHNDVAKDSADHELRIRQLERGRWPLPTLAALVAVAALVLSFIKITN